MMPDCEKFRRALWGLKNNQTRKERFFRWFLTFVAIESNLDAFAWHWLPLIPSPQAGRGDKA
ncbi:hypothetical protein CDG77_14510 [Nostoc sp. 'Peltigera membranacea cyanobiont' 213]|nr:hypothetical protein CDG77_14510 [Nostoc sp. 'Peltigera membranacea cyanobiont' 213]